MRLLSGSARSTRAGGLLNWTAHQYLRFRDMFARIGKDPSQNIACVRTVPCLPPSRRRETCLATISRSSAELPESLAAQLSTLTSMFQPALRTLVQSVETPKDVPRVPFSILRMWPLHSLRGSLNRVLQPKGTTLGLRRKGPRRRAMVSPCPGS